MKWLRCIWYVLNLRCDEADRIRTRIALEEATFTERLAERLHRFICSACRRVRAQLNILDEALRQVDDEPMDDAAEGMSAEARQRAMQALQKEIDNAARD